MSRSCHSVTFSRAGTTALRTTRARPVRFSVSTGLRLCGMEVARDHLRGDRLDSKAELLGDVLFDPRIDVGEGADRPRNGAGRDLGARRDQPGAIAGEGRIVAGQLDAESRGLRMDAVAAADGKRV